MADGKRVLVTTYQPMFESERGHARTVEGYMDVLNGKETPVIGEEALLSEVRGEFGKTPEFLEYSDMIYTTTLLDSASIPEEEYDAVLMVNHLTSFATSLGSTLGMARITDGAPELVGKSIQNGLGRLREKNVPVYVAEWIGFNSYSPLARIAFPGDEIGKNTAEVYEKILGDAGFSVESVKRFDFESGRLERNDKHGEYILLKAVPVSAPV